MSKVTFHGETKLITINEGVDEIDVQTDLYSASKLWLMEDDNAK
jgi:hypothetical protein